MFAVGLDLLNDLTNEPQKNLNSGRKLCRSGRLSCNQLFLFQDARVNCFSLQGRIYRSS